MSITLRRAREADCAVVKDLLEAAGLPVEDLEPAHLAFTADDDGVPVGAIGLESSGDIGLLRSLVVATDARSSGIGARLVGALEREARSQEIRELWLLTIDADAYFRRLGYVVRERGDAPAAIRDTAEFSDLCPGTAILMSKDLGDSHPNHG